MPLIKHTPPINMSKKYISTFDQWLSEATDRSQSLGQRIQQKTQTLSKYAIDLQRKTDSAKKNIERSTEYKKKAASADSSISKEINTSKSNLSQMKTQINSAEAKLITMKQKLTQEEIKTLQIEKTQADTKKK